MVCFKKLAFTGIVLLFVATGYGQVVAAPGKIDTTSFVRVEVEPTYPGGLDAWKAFLLSNKTLQKTADVAGATRGIKKKTYIVLVKFLVDKDGSVSEVKALTRHGFGLEEGAVKVIQESGKWSPALYRNQPVKAFQVQPISFVFQ